MSANDIRIGVEIEILPDNVQPNGCLTVQNYLTETYGHPDRWDVGTDSPNVESRTRGTIPLGDFVDHVAVLKEYMETHWVDNYGPWLYNYYTGMHVHINGDPSIGPSVERPAMLAAYRQHAEGIRDLCVDRDIRTNPERGAYNRLIDITDEVTFAQSCLRSEIQLNGLGTFEVRIWDATFDMDVIAARYRKLVELVETAQAMGPEVVSQIESFRQHSDQNWRDNWIFLPSHRLGGHRRGYMFENELAQA